MNKKETLAKTLDIDIGDIEINLHKNAWYEVDIYTNTMTDEHYVVLDASEVYYNLPMYGLEEANEIIAFEYNIYEL